MGGDMHGGGTCMAEQASSAVTVTMEERCLQPRPASVTTDCHVLSALIDELEENTRLGDSDDENAVDGRSTAVLSQPMSPLSEFIQEAEETISEHGDTKEEQ